MPHYTYSRGARRKKLFARISSTFINKPNSNSSILESGKMLHSKSTYFYRCGSKLNYVVPSVCGLALLVSGMITFNPILNYSSRAHATGIKDTGDTGESTGSDADTTPSISIAFPTTGLPEGYNNNAEQTTTVTPGVVAYRSNYFDVTVKNPSWYAVSVRAAKGYTSELKNADSTNPAAIISGVGENVTPNNFKDNTWGYALTKVNSSSTVVDDTTLQYSTLPDENSTNIDQPGYITDNTISDHYKVSFATLFSGDMPSGHYTTKVYLSAVTNPGHVASNFNNIGYMQAMTSEICSNADIGATAQLKDARDDKAYWAAKLVDGNCWMTQNLDFDIPEKLSNAMSDVDGDNVLTGITGPTSQWSMGTKAGTVRQYYDPGDYVYSYSGYGQSNISTCNGVKSFSDSQCSKVFSLVNSSSDLHYHVGNYYSYAAATVGSNDGKVSTYTDYKQAPLSICPRGWKLPINSNNGSFANMLGMYGISSTSLSVGDNSIYGKPIYLTYSGYFSGSINNAAIESNYWLATAGTSNYSDPEGIGMNLQLNDRVNPADVDQRATGFSVRCVFIP